MRDIALITMSSIKNNLRSRMVAGVAFGVVIICAIGMTAALSLLLIAPAMKMPSPDKQHLETYLSLILFAINLLGLGVNLNAFAFQNLTREKSRGIIQSLLATPLNEKQIWFGKSLAIFLPGLMLGELLTMIALLTINYVFFVPQMGFIINPWIIVSSFVAVPLMYLSLSLLVYLIGLTSKPANGNVISIIFLPLIITLIINLVLRSGLNAGGWIFTLTNLGIAVGIGTISLILQPRLTKERIIMSN